MNRTLVLLVLLALAAGCAQSAQQSSQSPASASGPASPASSAANPIGFPLYQQSTVLAARNFTQSAGAQSVSGMEVIAENPATIAQLSDWIKSVGTAPPSGYVPAPSTTAVEAGRKHLQAMGIDFQAFTHDVNGRKRVLVVLVVDPATFDAKVGPILSTVGKFKLLPQPMKDSIDAQVKERTGYTVSDALDPHTPIGGALEAVGELRSSGERGIVLIDGAKS